MSKQIVCADALPWLDEHRDVGSILTGLPDAEEIGAPIDEWMDWFTRAAFLCIQSTSPKAPTIFCVTDRKADGRVVSKAKLIMTAAEQQGEVRLLWHKIVLRRDVGACDLHRPTYSHLLAFSRECGPGKATPDVIPAGRIIYKNAMGLNAAQSALTFAMSHDTRLVDPFCGRGTVPAMAHALGLDAVGVDIDPEQCRFAESLVMTRPA